LPEEGFCAHQQLRLIKNLAATIPFIDKQQERLYYPNNRLRNWFTGLLSGLQRDADARWMRKNDKSIRRSH
jgi:hypothetical protein